MLNSSHGKSMENTMNDIRLSPHLASPNEATLSHPNKLDGVRLSPHFKLTEFLNLKKYAENVPTMQHVVNMTYGCLMLLEPARQVVGPIIINSGYRNPRVNSLVGGVKNSQHLIGQAADIRPKNPQQFQRLVDFLKSHDLTDQLLTGNGWLHISWTPFAEPRHYVRIGYYK
jgi:hypothetical protein